MHQIPDIVSRQHRFFQKGTSKEISWRIEQLKKLKHMLKEHEEDLLDAVRSDFKKPAFETYATELQVLFGEIDLAIKKLPSWSRPRKVSGSLINFPSKNYIYFQPYGVVLVIGAWNYPILLALQPAVNALAAGNTVIIKPSEFSARTSAVLTRLIKEYFDPAYFTAVEGEAQTAQQLLKQDLDYIFFTGSPRVGQLVMEAAARQLTPVTLELGGKSPTLVDQTANLKTAAKRIAWGKFINAGQTCLAPDYLCVASSVKDEMIALLSKSIEEFFGDDPRSSPDYSRIINNRHLERLTGYLDSGKVFTGGRFDSEDCYLAPTILDEVTWNAPVMQEEIFGPVLPVLTFDDLNEAVQKIKDRPEPLALYIFSEDDQTCQKIIREIPFGNGCINDTVAHWGNHELPFGGIGQSGMGYYHGKAGFLTFSHRKSIMQKSTWIDIPFRYAPYKNKLSWLKKLFG